jgi:hypothetical protein
MGHRAIAVSNRAKFVSTPLARAVKLTVVGWAKGGPATAKISGREEKRRQHRANRPGPVGPAAWIDEGGDVDSVKQQAPGRSAGTWSSEFVRTWRSAGTCVALAILPPVPAFHDLSAVPCHRTADTSAVRTISCSAVAC